ncbi:MAG: hypothetical protein HY709_04855 [Candidatus Latescibacteria bacterium]|nr:hypothetical protein [Candidatus Latescibacterota bacterium]
MNLQLLPLAEENLKGARLALYNGLLRVAASCAYYAVYAAMWAYLGDPPKGRWAHGGITVAFLQRLHADFTEVDLVPYGYRATRRKVEDLYAQRLQADYSVEPIDQEEVSAAVGFSEWLVSLIRVRCLL